MKLEKILEKRNLAAAAGWLKANLSGLKVVYTDVDGTLLGPEGCLLFDAQKNLTLRPAQAIVSVLQRGIDIVMVSGRHAKQLRENARFLGFKNYIAEMGTLIIYDQGRELVLNLGDYVPTENSVFESIRKSGAIDFLLRAYPRKLENHDPWSDERDCTPLFRGQVYPEEANQLLAQAGYQNLKLVDNGRILRTSPTLDVAEMHAYHLVPGGVSKASAIARDLTIRGIERSSAVAFGDAAADLEFSEQVGAFFLVKNGLKGNARVAEKILERENVFVTEQEMGLGWSEAIEFLLQLFPV